MLQRGRASEPTAKGKEEHVFVTNSRTCCACQPSKDSTWNRTVIENRPAKSVQRVSSSSPWCFSMFFFIQGNCCINRCSSWALFTDIVSQCQNCRCSYWLWSLYLRFHGDVFSCERIGNASKTTSCLYAQSQVIYIMYMYCWESRWFSLSAVRDLIFISCPRRTLDVFAMAFPFVLEAWTSEVAVPQDATQWYP